MNTANHYMREKFKTIAIHEIESKRDHNSYKQDTRTLETKTLLNFNWNSGWTTYKGIQVVCKRCNFQYMLHQGGIAGLLRAWCWFTSRMVLVYSVDDDRYQRV